MPSTLRLLASIMILFACTARAGSDGRLFDHGQSLQVRSERADPALDHMQHLLGQWDVSIKVIGDKTVHSATGQAEIRFMNRGHAFQERRHVDHYDDAGNDADVMSFLVYSPGTKQWALGEASGYTEHIEIYNGNTWGNGLELATSVRRLGGMQLTHYRLRYKFESNDHFTTLLEQSTGLKSEWTLAELRTYVRRKESSDFMPSDGYGSATADRGPEAAEFDFLLGEWAAAHQMNLGGSWVKFPVTSTAVFVMGGHGILEHSWHDNDPSLPDAATSIVRLYNRSERRWESLYLSNRNNSLLEFGGQLEGDQLVLHNFETQRGDPIQHFVFHAAKTDTYSWYAETSNDRGKTFSRFWSIDFQRLPMTPRLDLQ